MSFSACSVVMLARGLHACRAVHAAAACRRGAAVAGVSTIAGDFEAFERVVLARRTCRRFDSERPVSEDLLRRICALTLRSPSGLNMTPYVVVLVTDPSARARLAQAMLGGNSNRVATAPVTAVFAADLQPYRRVQEVITMERDAGKPVAYLRNLELDAAVVTSGCGGSPVQAAKSTLMSLASLAAPMPTVNSSEGWAFKNTALAAQTYMLACSAAGVFTNPMEGFDGARVMAACGIPASRYAVPMVVATGYPTPAADSVGAGSTLGPEADGNGNGASGGGIANDTGAGPAGRDVTHTAASPSPRPDPACMFRLNTFTTPFEGVPRLA